MITEEKVEVKIKNGVYLDKGGDYFVIELGTLKHKITGKLIPGMKVTGHDADGKEVEVVVTMDDTERVVNLCKLIHNSEYLGEL